MFISSLLPRYAQAAHADISFYISMKAGGGFAHSNKDYERPIGYGVLGAIGGQYELKDVNLRSELEISNFSYSKNKHTDDYPFNKYDKSHQVNTTLYMANFYVDLLHDEYKLKPYFGFGIGLAAFNENFFEDDYVYLTGLSFTTESYISEYTFSYGINMGIGFNITDNLSGDVGGRCVYFGRTYRFGTCDATIGLRYAF